MVAVNLATSSLATEKPYEYTLPQWFEGNRVQAHNEHGIAVAVVDAPRIHDLIHRAGANVLTRIILNRDEGAWWPSQVGAVHELTQEKDVAIDLVNDLHAKDMKMIGYFRAMSDAYMEDMHPDWVCRNWDGSMTIDPRSKRQEVKSHVICLHSPYKKFIQQRLIELAQRDLDAIYFDSWHMPEVCTCEYTRRAFEEATGRQFPYPAESSAIHSGPEPYSDEFLQVSEFISQTLVETFQGWREAVLKVKPDIFFVIGSSTYPSFHIQPQISDDFLEIADSSKTEFHKPFGGSVRFMSKEPDFAEPAFDLQTALGWSLTRDSSGGRPPLMWIPFMSEEREALYSAGAAVTYGCVASMAFQGEISDNQKKLFSSSFEMGQRISPHLAYSRPVPWAAIHISEASRNKRLSNPKALWKDVFSPALGAFETLKEAHLPSVTLTDKMLHEGRIAPETKLLILPWPDELTHEQKQSLEQAKKDGLRVIELHPDDGWHLASRKTALKQELIDEIYELSGHPPIRVSGPPRMHAVFFSNPEHNKLIICLMNSWGWYESKRPQPGQTLQELPNHISKGLEPAPCSGVTIEIDHDFMLPTTISEVVNSSILEIEPRANTTIIRIPDFQINNCVVIE